MSCLFHADRHLNNNELHIQLLLRNMERQQPKVELTRAAFAATQTVASANRQSVSQASLLWRRLVVQLVVQLRHPARLAHNLSTSSGFRLCSPSVLIKKQSAAGNQHSGPCCARCSRKRFTALNSLWFGQGLKGQLGQVSSRGVELTKNDFVNYVSSIVQRVEPCFSENKTKQ